MDRFTREDLRALLANPRPPCLSLLMPTTRGPANADKTRWKNLVRQAEECLTRDGHARSDIEELLQPAEALLDDVEFWQNASEGLAVFHAAELSRCYRVPLALEERLVIAPHFHLKPLVPLVAADGRFYVLALSKKQVRLFEGSRFTVEEIEPQGVPRSLPQALWMEDPSQRPRAEDAKPALLDYFQQIDRGLQQHLRDEAPLVVAGVDYLLPIYRQANSYPQLLDVGLEGNFDRLSAKEVHDRAWAVVQPHFQLARDRILGLKDQLAAAGRAATDLRAIVKAAYEGQVQYLLLSADEECWGRHYPETQEVVLHDEQQADSEDLVNLAVVYTLSHKGTVYTVEPGQLGKHEQAAAVFWLPLGERRDKRIVAAVAQP